MVEGMKDLHAQIAAEDVKIHAEADVKGNAQVAVVHRVKAAAIGVVLIPARAHAKRPVITPAIPHAWDLVT